MRQCQKYPSSHKQFAVSPAVIEDELISSKVGLNVALVSKLT
jgi:hypothetical protein